MRNSLTLLHGKIFTYQLTQSDIDFITRQTDYCMDNGIAEIALDINLPFSRKILELDELDSRRLTPQLIINKAGFQTHFYKTDQSNPQQPLDWKNQSKIMISSEMIIYEDRLEDRYRPRKSNLAQRFALAGPRKEVDISTLSSSYRRESILAANSSANVIPEVFSVRNKIKMNDIIEAKKLDEDLDSQSSMCL